MGNAIEYGIDPKKCVIVGCSGGGWVAVGACNLLAKKNDLSKIKALFIQTAFLSNSTQHMS